MGGFLLAWIVGEGIVIYRAVKKQHAPPGPGQLLWTSGVFVLLALLAQSQKARPTATLLAWGFVAAAALKLFPLQKQGLNEKADTTWPPAKAGNDLIFPAGDIAYNPQRKPSP